IIDHPSAWTSRSLGGKQGLNFPLGAEHLAALDEILARTRHLQPQGITRQDFDHPKLNPVLAELRDLIRHGRGAAIVTGITPERYSEEQFERICWGFGTHLGVAKSQSALGDRLRHITVIPTGPLNPAGRTGSQGDRELRLHADPFEIAVLMSVRKA